MSPVNLNNSLLEILYLNSSIINVFVSDILIITDYNHKVQSKVNHPIEGNEDVSKALEIHYEKRNR